jgi:hypothetical protein
MNPQTTALMSPVPTNDLQPLLIKYWVAKTIAYCPDSRLKGQRIFDSFLTSVQIALQNHSDVEIRLPSRPVFYRHLREAISKGIIGADYVVNQEDMSGTSVPRDVRVTRRTDGLYFEDLFYDLKRLYLPDFPVLLDNSYRANLIMRAQQTGIEKLFVQKDR